MSEVEIYWEKIREKVGDNRTWNELSPNQQNAVIHSINLLISVLNGSIQ